jgi:hypothetical protein
MRAAIQLIILTVAALPVLAQPNVDVTVTPVNPPIVIQASGGSFQYLTSIVNNGPGQVLIWTWNRAWLHGQTFPGLVITPPSLTPPVGLTVVRQRTQNIPGIWHPGEYIYRVYVGLNPYSQILDSSDFTFTKLATFNSESTVWEASDSGKLFPGEQLLITHNSSLITSANPNPFNPTTAISYKLQAVSHVSLKVYDTAGRLVATLADGWREAGTHQATFDGSNLASGVYLYALQTEDETITGKMMLLK